MRLWVLLSLCAIASARRQRHQGTARPRQGSPPICAAAPPWRLNGVKVMSENRGNVTLVALMELNCQFCATQISGIKNLVKQVQTNVMQRFSFVIIAPRNETRAWVSYWKKALEPHGIQVYQESGRNPIWSLLQGRNHDFFIYDRCGRLVYFIPHPQSFLYYHYTISSLTSAHNYAQCGECRYDAPFHRMAPLPAGHPSTPTPSFPVRRIPPPLESPNPYAVHAPIRPHDPRRPADPRPTHPPTSPFPSVFALDPEAPWGAKPPTTVFPTPDPRAHYTRQGHDQRRRQHNEEQRRRQEELRRRQDEEHRRRLQDTRRQENRVAVVYPQSHRRPYTQPVLTYPPDDPRAEPVSYPQPQSFRVSLWPKTLEGRELKFRGCPSGGLALAFPGRRNSALLGFQRIVAYIDEEEVTRAPQTQPQIQPEPTTDQYVYRDSAEGEEASRDYEDANEVEVETATAQIPPPTSPTPPSTDVIPTRKPKIVDGISCEQFPDSVCYELQEANRAKGTPLHRCCYKGIYATDKCVPKLCTNATYALCCFQKFIQARYLCCHESALSGGRADEFSRCCYQNFVELDGTDPCCPAEVSRPYWSTKTSLYELCMPNIDVDYGNMVLEAVLRDSTKTSVVVSELKILNYTCPYVKKRSDFFYYQPPPQDKDEESTPES